MFTRILVANRGEIALRIIRCCRALGVETVSVYSEPDAASPHVTAADRAVRIGAAHPAKSYLLANTILHVAAATACDAIHPGYGFLSENGGFARQCASEGMTFIGPPAETIDLMGNKAAARRKSMELGVPVVPGTSQSFDDPDEAAAAAGEIGFPILLKARAGGGGRGMRVVDEPAAFPAAFTEARNEAEAAFADGAIYLERFFRRVRHVEVQVFGDNHGAVRQLGERDCTVQRRHQKLIEEAPSPVLSPTVREALCGAAVDLARGVGYRNAGTVEFIYDSEAEAFYFIEMNTRIQVEHPVTEALTDTDLIAEQIRVAAGEKLSVPDVSGPPDQHAIEFRVNAEDPADGFRPCPGRIGAWRPPAGDGIRWDGFPYPGYQMQPFYDSLLGKLIVTGRDRDDAIANAISALDRFEVDGVKTTIPFHLSVLRNPDFREADIHTRWIDEGLKTGAGAGGNA